MGFKGGQHYIGMFSWCIFISGPNEDCFLLWHQIATESSTLFYHRFYIMLIPMSSQKIDILETWETIFMPKLEF